MADKRAAVPRGAACELLSPAGDMERLEMALAYGADAVYLAGERFGLRASSGNFTAEEMARAAVMCHERGVSVYAACNTVMSGDDVRALPAYFERLAEAGADAVILTDLGALRLAKRYAPGLKIHISTQAGVTNEEAALAFYELGASRVILARELTLGDIAEIREKTPKELELEAFVHGSLCVSFSGRCLLSQYLAGRDANRGACAQPCRWKYRLVEEKRPGEYFDISEDGGTYILNSRDLCMIGHIPELLGAGVTSLKIEGRMKSAYYAAAVTNAYRHALDAALEGRPLGKVWLEEVGKISHRPYTTGFYFSAEGPGQFTEDARYFSDSAVVAVVERSLPDGSAVLTQRNRFFRGDTLELLAPGRAPVPFTADDLRDETGAPLDAAPHPMMTLLMRLPADAPRLSILRKSKAETA